jgi:methyltransferase-like protein
MDIHAIYRKKEEIVTRDIAGETLLVPIRSHLADMRNIFALNPTAAYIWEQLDGRQSLDDIHRGIMDHFQVDNRQALDDLEEFIGQLLDAGIIQEKTGREK